MSDTYIAFPKIARLRRDIIVTEKIDGTNGQIFIWDELGINPDTDNLFGTPPDGVPWLCDENGIHLAAGSKSRWVTPLNDNYGFASWAQQNASDLIQLGHGRHFGEWWGSGIQRKYGLKEKRFSLFNTTRWKDGLPRIPGVHVVPVLYQGMFDEGKIIHTLWSLQVTGSVAAPGYMNPEGVVIFHTASGAMFKQTIFHDEVPKGKGEDQ